MSDPSAARVAAVSALDGPARLTRFVRRVVDAQEACAALREEMGRYE